MTRRLSKDMSNHIIKFRANDPLAPIREVYEKYKGKMGDDGSGPWGYERELWKAIKKAVEQK